MSNPFCRLLSLTIVVLYLAVPTASAWQSDPPTIPGFDAKALEEMSKQAAEAMNKALADYNKTVQKQAGDGADRASVPEWLKPEHWDMMSEGMPESAVKVILGPAVRVAQIGSIQSWSYGIVNDKQELAATEVVGQVSIENGKVAKFGVDRQRLASSQAKWKAAHAAGGSEEKPGEATPVTPKPAGNGLPNYLAMENWSLVKIGMSTDQVRTILGEPSKSEGTPYFVWTYSSAQNSGPGMPQRFLGSVDFMSTVSRVVSPDPELLEKERAFWVANGLGSTADTSQDKSLTGCPGWLSLNQWPKVKEGMTQAQVEDILGPPNRPIDANSAGTFNYDAWSTYEQGGSVRMAKQPGSAEKVAETRTPSATLLKDMTDLIRWQRASGGDWPRWTNPAAWATMPLKAGPDEVLALFGEPERKERKADLGQTNRPMVEHWFYGNKWSSGKVNCSVTFSDPDRGFPEVLRAQAPDWKALATEMQSRGGSLAQAARWSDPEAWLRFKYLLMSTQPFEQPDAHLFGKPQIEWVEGHLEPGGNGVWRAICHYDDGGSIGYITSVPKSQPQPETSSLAFVDEVVPPPAPSTKKQGGLIKKAAGASGDDEYKRVLRIAMWKTMECQFDKSSGLLMHSYVNMRDIERIIGAPDRIERTTEKCLYEFHPGSDRNGKPDPEPEPQYIDASLCILHYGDGAIALMVEHPRAGEVQPDLPRGGKLVRLAPPSTESMAAATGGHPWPSLGPATQQPDAQQRPTYLDAARWNRIETGDSTLWAIHVLGQPTKSDADPEGTRRLTYGPWTSGDKNERWYAGTVECAKSAMVTKCVPPQRKTD